MTSKAQAHEAYLEEHNRLEVELKQLQHELSDTVELNDELTKVIAQKDEELVVKDKRLESLRERNIADGEQLELESATLADKYGFEVSTKEEVVRKLEIQYERFLEIQCENDALRETVDRLQALMESNRDSHALKMHEKNLEMKTLREAMEKKMRDELNKMDISYQKDAFAALSEHHKKAMFQNAKLKDEVALQGVGLNNLGSRLAKQDQQHDACLKQLKSLNKRLRMLKERLATIARKKIEISRKKEDVLADETRLLAKRSSLKGSLEANPKTQECSELREQLHIEILNARCAVVMWTQRLLLLQDLHQNLKPVYEHELMGRFNPKTFPLEASISLHSSVGRNHSRSRGRLSSAGSLRSQSQDSHESDDNVSRTLSPIRSQSPTLRADAAASPTVSFPDGSAENPHSSDIHAADVAAGVVSNGVPYPNSGVLSPASASAFASTTIPPVASISRTEQLVQMMIKPAEIEELIERDPTLGDALAPLRGKEAQILTTVPDETSKKVQSNQKHEPPAPDRDQNMIAWVTLKLVDIWEITRLETERLKAEKSRELEQVLDALHSETAMGVFSGDTSQNASKHGSYTQFPNFNPDEDANIRAPLEPTESVVMHEEAGASEIERVREKIDLEFRGDDHNFIEDDEIKEIPCSDFDKAEKSIQNESEALALLSESARNLEDLVTMKSGEFKALEVPTLPMNLLEQKACVDDALRSSQLERQAERDWIENGELDEDAVHQLWDAAFSLPPSTQPSQSNIEFSVGHSPVNPQPSWLKKVPPAKRFPVFSVHDQGTIPRKNKQKNRLLNEEERPNTADTDKTSSAPTKNITTELLLRDIKPVDASSAYDVSPPILLHDKTSALARETIAEMRRSLSRPQLPNVSQLEKSQSSTALGIGVEYTGLEVTEDGLVLKDPLLRKKFDSQRKQLVANAAKTAAALKRATKELHKYQTSALPGNTVAINRNGLPQRASVLSMSANLIGQKSLQM